MLRYSPKLIVASVSNGVTGLRYVFVLYFSEKSLLGMLLEPGGLAESFLLFVWVLERNDGFCLAILCSGWLSQLCSSLCQVVNLGCELALWSGGMFLGRD